MTAMIQSDGNYLSLVDLDLLCEYVFRLACMEDKFSHGGLTRVKSCYSLAVR
jgi:hypothetical protein